jgi:signal transduction histidine kinase
MKSLRKQLLTYLWATLLLVGVASATVSFVVSRNDTNELLDFQMEQIAALLGATQFDVGSKSETTPGPDSNGDLEDAYVIRVADANGRTLYASRSEISSLPIDWLGFRTLRIGNADYRIFAARTASQRIAVGQQLELRQEAAAQSALLALIPILLLIPILGIVITLVIRRQLLPLGAATTLVASRPPLDLTPLPTAGLPAEVFPLVDEINRLLARLRESTELEHRFITDAAHALRTPLTALQLQVDVLEGTADHEKRAGRVSELRAGIRRTVRLANQLLLLARRATAPPAADEPIDLDLAVEEVCALYEPVALSRSVQIKLEARSKAQIMGSARQVTQLTGNLLDNALRHAPADSAVTIATRTDARGAVLEIADAGAGLPDDQLEKVFERFYRAPGDVTEGSGLGLAVVREMASQLGGTVKLQNRQDRTGLLATVWLPTLGITGSVAKEKLD